MHGLQSVHVHMCVHTHTSVPSFTFFIELLMTLSIFFETVKLVLSHFSIKALLICKRTTVMFEFPGSDTQYINIYDKPRHSLLKYLSLSTWLPFRKYLLCHIKKLLDIFHDIECNG